MIMRKNILKVLSLLLLATGRLHAQTDPHFTQQYTFPMYLNPALTGSSDGEYRASAIYRSQWGSISNPYRTIGISFDTRTNKNIAIGVNLLQQSAGDGGFNYLSSYVSLAYTGVKFGKDNNQHLVFALQPGLISRNVDPSRFKWGEQWDPITGYNAGNSSTENFDKTSAVSFDAGAGVLYYDAADKKINTFGGFSVFHLNRPADPILSSQSTELNVIPLRYSIHAGLSVQMSEQLRLVPHILYMAQGTASEAALGTYLELNVNEETDLMLGGYYRLKDAIAPYIGIDWRDLVIGISYDANTSKLGSMTRNVNSFELSLSYVKRRDGKSIVDFIRCARL